MADPRDPTPATVEQREGYWVVVDRDGDALPGQSAHQDEEAARELAARVNSTWSAAKAERKSKVAEARAERVERRAAAFERLLGG